MGVPVFPYDKVMLVSGGALGSNLEDSSLILQTPVRAYLNSQIILYHTFSHMSNLIKKAYKSMTYDPASRCRYTVFGQFALH